MVARMQRSASPPAYVAAPLALVYAMVSLYWALTNSRISHTELTPEQINRLDNLAPAAGNHHQDAGNHHQDADMRLLGR